MIPIEPIHILIVDDQDMIRQALSAMLESKEGLVVIGEAADGDEAVVQAQRLKPDVILMDIKMPKKNGVTAIREIMESMPDSRILVLSSFSDDGQIVESMRAGAMGYILKDARIEELISAIYQVHAGETPLNPMVARRLVKTLAQPRTEPLLEMMLTERELDIVRLVAKGMSNSAVASELGIAPRTVGTHVSHIMAKAEVENRTQLALLAVRQGLAPLY